MPPNSVPVAALLEPATVPVATPSSRPCAPAFRYSGFWERFVAMVIDSFVFIPIAVVLSPPLESSASSCIPATFEGMMAAMLGVSIIAVLMLIFAGSWLYHTLMESSRYQATLGKWCSEASSPISTDVASPSHAPTAASSANGFQRNVQRRLHDGWLHREETSAARYTGRHPRRPEIVHFGQLDSAPGLSYDETACRCRACHRDSRPAKLYGSQGCCRWPQPHRSPRHLLRISRPQRRREVHHHPDAHRPHPAHLRVDRAPRHALEGHELEIKRRIGLVPDESLLFDRLTGVEFLEFVGRMYGLVRVRSREERAGSCSSFSS